LRYAAVLSGFFLTFPIAAAGDPERLVESVSIEGSGARYTLATKAGEPFDRLAIERDVRALYATGRFSDVRAESRSGSSGNVVTFRVVEAPRLILRDVRVQPADASFKPDIRSGVPIDKRRASGIAADLRNRLERDGYTDVRVEPELVRVSAAEADLVLRVAAGSPVKVAAVNLIGEPGLDREELARNLQNLRGRRWIPAIPGLWKGWRSQPAYHHAAVQSDLSRVQSLYLERGYFDGAAQLDRVQVSGGKAAVEVALDPGPRYLVRRWEVRGTGRGAGRIEGEFRADKFCRCLLDMRRRSEKQGFVDFDVRLTLRAVYDLGGQSIVDLVASVERGQPYMVRRIVFEGNRRFSGGMIRANLVLQEGEPLDATLLRKSLDRLNRSLLFEPINERNVELVPDRNTGTAEVRIRLREKKFGAWFLSGPAGPASIGGPLQFTLASRLPPWGKGILELSSYYASFSLTPGGALWHPGKAKVVPLFALQRPFTAGEGWKSGFALAPQLGWKIAAFRYGATQARERALPVLAGNRHLTPVLPVVVERTRGDAVMFCEPPKPRLNWLRGPAAAALKFAGPLAGL
jgi:outer membrane protein assembly factor BamA